MDKETQYRIHPARTIVPASFFYSFLPPIILCLSFFFPVCTAKCFIQANRFGSFAPVRNDQVKQNYFEFLLGNVDE